MKSSRWSTGWIQMAPSCRVFSLPLEKWSKATKPEAGSIALSPTCTAGPQVNIPILAVLWGERAAYSLENSQRKPLSVFGSQLKHLAESKPRPFVNLYLLTAKYTELYKIFQVLSLCIRCHWIEGLSITNSIEIKSSHLQMGGAPKRNSSSNHWFSGAKMLVSGRDGCVGHGPDGDVSNVSARYWLWP